MAISQLAGPFAIVDGTGTAIPEGGIGQYVVYIPSLGLAVIAYPNTNLPATSVALLAVDGILQYVAQNMAGLSYVGFNLTTGLMMQMATGVSYYRENVSLSPYLMTSSYALPTTPGAGGSFSDLPNRRLTANTYGDLYSCVGPTLPFVLEATCLIPGRPEVLTNLSAGRTTGEVFVSWSYQGAVPAMYCAFYNTLTKKFSSELFYFGVGGVVAVYAADLGVVLLISGGSGTTPYSLTVWSLYVFPTQVTAPVLLNGSTAQGGIGTYQTQVLGAQGEVCVGQLVNWSITGAGTLLDQQTTTDSNGNATARVLFGAGDTGQVDVTAEVTC